MPVLVPCVMGISDSTCRIDAPPVPRRPMFVKNELWACPNVPTFGRKFWLMDCPSMPIAETEAFRLGITALPFTPLMLAVWFGAVNPEKVMPLTPIPDAPPVVGVELVVSFPNMP